MPEYTLASLLVLALGLLVAGVTGVLRERAAWAGLLVFGAITVVADVMLTGLPIVTYGREHNVGLYLGPMPIEDLLYGLGLYLVAIAAWGRRPAAGRGSPAEERGSPTDGSHSPDGARR